MRNFFDKNGPLVAFLILALIGGWAIRSSSQESARTLYKSQIEACERGNILRAESNRRVASHVLDAEVLGQFLTAAREARRAGNTPTDKTAAEDYTNLLERLQRVRFEPVKIVNCAEAIPEP